MTSRETVSRGSVATFGEMLKRFRLRAGFSQSALAQAAQINRSYVSRLESGAREITNRSLALRLAEILALSPFEADLWLISAGYVSPRKQKLGAKRAAQLLADMEPLGEDVH